MQQDYLLRLIEQLRQFAREIARLRGAKEGDAALLVFMNAQEKLFGLPSHRVTSRTLEEQFEALVHGESPAHAWDKCSAYAELLTELGHLYREKDEAEPAAGAFRMALHILLLAASRDPVGAPPGLHTRLRQLRAELEGHPLPGNVQDLFSQVEQGRRSRAEGVG